MTGKLLNSASGFLALTCEIRQRLRVFGWINVEDKTMSWFSNGSRRLFLLACTGILVSGFGGQVIYAQTTAAQWYGPHQDGCYYYGSGTNYTERACLQSDGAYDVYLPGTATQTGQWVFHGDSWFYADGSRKHLGVDGSTTTLHANGTMENRVANGIYVVRYVDGTAYGQATNGLYVKLDAAGNLVESGNVNSNAGGTNDAVEDVTMEEAVNQMMLSSMVPGMLESISESQQITRHYLYDPMHQ